MHTLWTDEFPADPTVTQLVERLTPIDPGRDYRMVTHEGMLQGLHRYLTFAAGRGPKVSGQSVTEVVEEMLRRRGVVRAAQLGNVTLVCGCPAQTAGVPALLESSMVSQPLMMARCSCS